MRSVTSYTIPEVNVYQPLAQTIDHQPEDESRTCAGCVGAPVLVLIAIIKRLFDGLW